MNIKIDITIPNASQGTSSANQKGVLKSETEDEYLARRISGFVMNIYDVGQINTADEGDDPVWETQGWKQVPDISYGFATPVVTPLTMAQQTDLLDQILLVDEEDWKKKYRRLDKDTGFMLGVDVVLLADIDDAIITQGKNYFSAAKDDEREVLYRNLFESEFPVVTPVPVDKSTWSDNGIKLKNAIKNIVMVSGGWFNSGYNTSPPGSWQYFSDAPEDNPGFVKITETRDYSADPVTNISIKEAVDVFLFPLPVLPVQTVEDVDFTHYLFAPYQVPERSIWAYDTDFADEIGGVSPLAAPQDQSAMGLPNLVAWFPRIVPIERQTTLRDHYKAQPGSLYARYDNTLGVYDFPSVAGFNPSTSAPTITQLKAGDSITGGGGYSPMFPGLLLAVLKTKNKSYYVWHTKDGYAGEDTFRDSNGQAPIRVWTNV